jgi:hypothetical protein
MHPALVLEPYAEYSPTYRCLHPELTAAPPDDDPGKQQSGPDPDSAVPAHDNSHMHGISFLTPMCLTRTISERANHDIGL